VHAFIIKSSLINLINLMFEIYTSVQGTKLFLKIFTKFMFLLPLSINLKLFQEPFNNAQEKCKENVKKEYIFLQA
jgi:hypothetical protein